MTKLFDKHQNITVDSREHEVVVRSRSGNRIRGSFSAISPLTNRCRTKDKSMHQDIFDRLDQVSKGAFSVFNNLKFNRSEQTNITQYSPEENMSKTDKETLSRKLTELKKVGLIRRMKKEVAVGDDHKVYTFKDPRKVFIINPDMIKCQNHDEAMAIWEECGR